MSTRLAWVVWAGLSLAGGQATNALEVEKERLKGTWVLEELRLGHLDAKGPQEARKPGSEGWLDIRLTFAGDRVTVGGWGESGPTSGPYRLDPAKNPKELDIGRGASRREYIYKLDGDRLF